MKVREDYYLNPSNSCKVAKVGLNRDLLNTISLNDGKQVLGSNNRPSSSRPNSKLWLKGSNNKSVHINKKKALQNQM